ncbi:hypothetical protein BD560DRAFT_323826 [Blakeslea trispora]|nr:hypothetical protein BD560DRAFT_323826 [Blakeslea trispora]
MTNQHQIHITTLNCRGLIKSNDSTKRSLFFRFLRSTQTDIFCFQETHAKTRSSISFLYMMHQSHSSLWNEHCGIVSFNPSYIIQSLQTLSPQMSGLSLPLLLTRMISLHLLCTSSISMLLLRDRLASFTFVI